MSYGFVFHSIFVKFLEAHKMVYIIVEIGAPIISWWFSVFLPRNCSKFPLLQQSPRCPLSSHSSRHLLVSLLWLLRNLDGSALKQVLSELPPHRLHSLLHLLYIALSCFQFKVTNCAGTPWIIFTLDHFTAEGSFFFLWWWALRWTALARAHHSSILFLPVC